MGLGGKRKSHFSEDSDEQSKRDNGLNDVTVFCGEVKNENPVVSRWPQDDIQTLLSRIEATLPKTDRISYRRRLAKVDWSQVQFNNYNKDECQSTWLTIQDQLLTFKTLNDLVQNAKTLLATKGIDTYQSKHNRVPKPKSAYMFYYTETLQDYKKKHPNLKLHDLTQIIAEKYKTLSPEKKQIYTDKAQKSKNEHNELVDKINVGFKSKITFKPKTPFDIFLKNELTDVEDNFDKTELVNHYKEKWVNMSEKKKYQWIKLASEREEIYLNILKEDHKNDPAYKMPTKSALTKDDRNILDSQSGKPKKPPVSSYGLFSKEILQSNELTGIQPMERIKIIAQRWKSSSEQRQIYCDKFKVITERYKTEYDAYLNTLTEEEKQLELAKNKKKTKKTKPKFVPRITAREGIIEKPKEKAIASKRKLILDSEESSSASENEKRLKLAKNKKKLKKTETKVVPRIIAREKITEKLKGKTAVLNHNQILDSEESSSASENKKQLELIKNEKKTKRTEPKAVPRITAREEIAGNLKKKTAALKHNQILDSEESSSDSSENEENSTSEDVNNSDSEIE